MAIVQKQKESVKMIKDYIHEVTAMKNNKKGQFKNCSSHINCFEKYGEKELE